MTTKPSWPPSLTQLRSWGWRRVHLSFLLTAIGILVLVWNFHNAAFAEISHHRSAKVDFSQKGAAHPIHKRFVEANRTYNDLLERQSRSLGEAKTEYKRRYQYDPPPGFGDWYEYAAAHKSLIIDDFDEVNEKLQPYRQFFKGGCDAQELDHDYLAVNMLVQVCIRNGELKFKGAKDMDMEDDWVVVAMHSMLDDFVSKIPDVCFVLNVLDEPRAILPPDALHLQEKSISAGDTFCPVPLFYDFSGENWWSEGVTYCPANSPARLFPGRDVSAKSGSLVETWNTASDLCASSTPVEHGMLLAPSTLMLTHTKYPILSNAALSTFSDIFYPSIWRYDGWDETQDTFDTLFENKTSNGYWRGSTTGGQNRKGYQWEKFQRHRFVAFANDEKHNPVADKMDVLFSNIVQCEEEACEEMKKEFKIASKAPMSDSWKFKIVFDFDGNGLSGRFYPLLRSNSAVFRQCAFREWHDSRMAAWVHYVPISMDMGELAELVEYFLGYGEDLLKEVAEKGKVMANRSLRREDQSIYMYRLLIEMSRRDLP